MGVKALEKLRQDGIINYYNTNSNFSWLDNKLEKTAEHAQCTVRHLEGMLKGKIQPTGESKDDKYVENLYKSLELVECTNDIKKINLI